MAGKLSLVSSPECYRLRDIKYWPEIRAKSHHTALVYKLASSLNEIVPKIQYQYVGTLGKKPTCLGKISKFKSVEWEISCNRVLTNLKIGRLIIWFHPKTGNLIHWFIRSKECSKL